MKRIIPFFLLLILLFLLKNVVVSIHQNLTNESPASKLDSQLLEEKKKSQFLQQRLFYVTKDEFIENEARTKLGMVKEGERIIIAPTIPPENQQPTRIDLRPNWKKWWDLFF